MMFGTREIFDYNECADCRSLQIHCVLDPETLARHYPNNYYSRLSAPPGPTGRGPRYRIRHQLMTWRMSHTLGFPSIPGAIVNAVHPNSYHFTDLKDTKIRLVDRVLDVGCGSAANLLNRMARFGFTKLTGSDPFVERDSISAEGVPVFKRALSELSESFDFIMFHHSLEHVPFPAEMLSAARAHLNPGGRCYVRIPTPSCEAFEKYGTDWAQLDAPRHMTLISRSGMDALANKSGFAVEWARDDSGIYQFYASELCLRDIPLCSITDLTNYFSRAELSSFERQAKRLRG